MATVLLNIHNAGFFEDIGLSMVPAMSIFGGGLAPMITGIMEYPGGTGSV